MGYLDSTGLSYVWQKLKTLFNTKVDKIEGKGLSENDYTTEEKETLAEHDEAMGFLVSFGNLCTSDGTLVFTNDSSSIALRSANVKVTSPALSDDKDRKIYLELIETIQSAIYSANTYTDQKIEKMSVATADGNGLMSASDKAHLDEIWSAWSTKQFLAVALDE